MPEECGYVAVTNPRGKSPKDKVRLAFEDVQYWVTMALVTKKEENSKFLKDADNNDQRLLTALELVKFSYVMQTLNGYLEDLQKKMHPTPPPQPKPCPPQPNKGKTKTASAGAGDDDDEDDGVPGVPPGPVGPGKSASAGAEVEEDEAVSAQALEKVARFLSVSFDAVDDEVDTAAV